jgi:hypothetical protein
MSVHKKRCRVCREWFMPNARTARFQKTCPRASCRRERKRQADIQWRSKNMDYDASRQGKKRTWAQAYPDYWRQYRAAHPAYVERNRAATRERKGASRLRFANQDAITRPIDGILTFLVRREGFANPNAIEQTAPVVR